MNEEIKMKSEQKVLDFLEKDGFNRSELKPYDDSNFMCYRRTKFSETKDCVSNMKVPQICVKGYSWNNVFSYQVELVQENNLAWLTFEYYGLSEDDLINKLDKLEESLIKAWEASFIGG